MRHVCSTPRGDQTVDFVFIFVCFVCGCATQSGGPAHCRAGQHRSGAVASIHKPNAKGWGLSILLREPHTVRGIFGLITNFCLHRSCLIFSLPFGLLAVRCRARGCMMIVSLSESHCRTSRLLHAYVCLHNDYAATCRDRSGVLQWRPKDRSRRFLILRYEPAFQSNAR